MLVDGNSIPPGAEIETELCIIGAGPACATIVEELGGRTPTVIIESGGLSDEPGARLLVEGSPGDPPGYDPYSLRHRQIGGTANCWGIKIGPDGSYCRYAPFDELDFEARDWVPHSGWPFTRADLEPFYRRAQVHCGLGPFRYDGEFWGEPARPVLEFPGGRLATTVFQFGPRHHFTTDFVRSVMRSETVTAVYRSTAVELQTDEHASVVLRVEARTLRGNRFFIRPRLVVLAMGGIENARLLLLSDHVSRQGLGNRHDLVGRFFMDHYMIHSGYLYPRDPGIFDRTGLYDLRLADDSGLGIQGKLTLRPRLSATSIS